MIQAFNNYSSPLTSEQPAPGMILFILNPKSGGSKNKRYDLEKIIRESFPGQEILILDSENRITNMRERILGNGYETVVAVGGDGTINMAATAVKNSPVALGIIPMGSGNGLARELGIPLDPVEALNLISNGTINRIDGGEVNGKTFFCTSGTGFDALIGHLFDSSATRGFYTYSKITLSSLLNYRPEVYQLIIDDKVLRRKAFLITVANARQYGNDVFIAPQANTRDGLLDICILKPFRLWQVPLLIRRMFKGTVGGSGLYESYRSAAFTIIREKDGPVHHDGEPFLSGNKLEYRVLPAALKVIVPRSS
jgi:YegS/Rv2252/BmrU family lipid kinase